MCFIDSYYIQHHLEEVIYTKKRKLTIKRPKGNPNHEGDICIIKQTLTTKFNIYFRTV